MWISWLDETPSTNDVVRERIERGVIDHGAAVQAGAQTAGRGRRGRSWVSPPGRHVYLSVAIVHPAVARAATWLPLAAGLAVADAAQIWCDAPLALKWPNDVLCDGRKLAGVLCEGVTRGGHMVGAVVGVGLNVADDGWPPELQGYATALASCGTAPPSVAEAGAAIRGRVVAHVDRLLAEGHAWVSAGWSERDATRGRRVVVPDGAVGVAVGLADDGGLRVDVDGAEIVVRAGEVTFADATAARGA